MVAGSAPDAVALRVVHGYEHDGLARAVEEHGRRLDGHADRLRQIELEGARTRTTIKIAAGVVAAVVTLAGGVVGWMISQVVDLSKSTSPAPARAAVVAPVSPRVVSSSSR